MRPLKNPKVYYAVVAAVTEGRVGFRPNLYSVPGEPGFLSDPVKSGNWIAIPFAVPHNIKPGDIVNLCAVEKEQEVKLVRPPELVYGKMFFVLEVL